MRGEGNIYNLLGQNGGHTYTFHNLAFPPSVLGRLSCNSALVGNAWVKNPPYGYTLRPKRHHAAKNQRLIPTIARTQAHRSFLKSPATTDDPTTTTMVHASNPAVPLSTNAHRGRICNKAQAYGIPRESPPMAV